MSALAGPQRAVLTRMARTAKLLHRHRDGWALSDGSVSCRDATVRALAAKGLIRHVDGMPAWTIAADGFIALAPERYRRALRGAA